MNQSRSLHEITTEFMSNSQMEELSPNDRKFILNQLKKLYSQQMGKVATELTKRNQVKNNKNYIQHKEELQIKSINQNIVKRMEQHNQKRQKVFNKKINHFKLLDENWKLKLEEIQRKKKEEYRQSMQKAAKYRKQIETFWSQNKKKNNSIKVDQTIPVIENEGYFSIRSEIKGTSNKLLKPQAEQFYQNKRKTQSKNELPTVIKTLLPNIEKKSYFISKTSNKNYSDNIPMHQSLHKFADEKTMQQHIQKSRHINTEKEELALQKALQKMKMIELKRKKCRQDRQKNIKQSKIKRQLRQETIAHAQKIKRLQQQDYPVKSSKQKRTEIKSIEYLQNISRSRSRKDGSFSLNESIVKHQRAKQELEEQKFSERGDILQANIMKQKKGKMIRMVKETINKLKQQALKDA